MTYGGKSAYQYCYCSRYQHHVADYDKQKWEVCMERRILHGINHIPTKSAKLQSSELQLIDLDLVRGRLDPSPHILCLSLFFSNFYPFFDIIATTQSSSSSSCESSINCFISVLYYLIWYWVSLVDFIIKQPN